MLIKGSQSKLDKNKDGKISGDDFKMMKKKGGGMMKKKGMAKGGKVRGSGIARQGVRAAIMVQSGYKSIKYADANIQ